MSTSSHEMYVKRQSMGLCGHCGINPTPPKTICTACKERIKAAKDRTFKIAKAELSFLLGNRFRG